MNDRDPYEAWKKNRRGVKPPAGFAQRVMDSVRAEGSPGPREVQPGPFVRLLANRYAAAAMVAAAVGLAVVRLGCRVAFLVLIPDKGF